MFNKYLYEIMNGSIIKGLAKRYYKPANPAGYTGDFRHLNSEKAQDWLSRQQAYTLHKTVRRRFPTRGYRTSYVDREWQADWWICKV